MRIGIATECFRPWPGGVAEHAYHEAVELRRRGHHVVILTGPSSQHPPDREFGLLRFGVELRYYNNGSRNRLVVGSCLLTLRRTLERLQLDVMHAHAPTDPGLSMAAAYAAPSPTVGTFHSNFEPTLLKTLGARLVKPVFDKLARRIAVSRTAMHAMSRLFPGEYEIIPNGVDTDRFHPDTAPLDEMWHDGPTILFTGRPDRRKGLPLLLSALADVRRRIPRTRLVVAGDVSLRRQRQLLANGPDELASWVTFLGYVPPAVLPRYVASSDVVCSPAIGNESQGIVLLEAMAAGRTVVAFDIPGYRDVITHGHDGWLVPSIDARRLADALVEIIEDPLKRRTLGQRARETALKYQWPLVAERLEAQFMRALATA